MITQRYCRACGQPSGGHYCSQACLDEYRSGLSEARFREAVFARDKGLCVACDLDTTKLERVVGKLRERATATTTDGITYRLHSQWWRAQQTLIKLASSYSWAFRDTRRFILVPHLWEADHKLAKCRGGSNSIRNAQTLCLGCHRKKTGEDRRMKREES